MSIIPPYQHHGEFRPTELPASDRGAHAGKAAATVHPMGPQAHHAHDEAAFASALGTTARREAVPGAGIPARSILYSGKNLRMAYQTGRLKGLHATFVNAFLREDDALPAGRLLEMARQGGDLGYASEFLAADPFKRYLLLLEAQEQAAARSDAGEASRRLQKALDSEWRTHRSRITAGFNTAEPLLRFAERLDEWNFFREVYFDWVVHTNPLATTFKSLLEKFGIQRIRGAIDTLRDAISADLASPIVCSDRARMEQQQRDLEENRKVSSLFADTESLCKRLSNKTPEAEQVVKFVGSVLDYVASSSTKGRLEALYAAAVPPADAVTEYVRWEVRQFMKVKVPLTLWISEESRGSLFPRLAWRPNAD